MTSVSVFTAGFTGDAQWVKGRLILPLLTEALWGTLPWDLFIVAFRSLLKKSWRRAPLAHDFMGWKPMLHGVVGFFQRTVSRKIIR